jgi:tetratricopeptide (TPR) repeat protein
VTKRSERRSAKPRAAAPKRGPREWIFVVAILALTWLAYLPSLDNDFTNWDDTQYVLENPLLPHADLGAILRTPVGGNYHPLTILSLAVNYRISGLKPDSYHALSLGLHLANTALVFVFVWMLTGGRRWTSVVTSLLFGIHPMHVESVAWMSERKDVLYAFFYLLGLLAYLKYLEKPKVAWWAATGVALILSLASKPAAVVFPVTLLAIDWYRKRAWSPRWLAEKSLWFAASLAGGLLTLHAQAASGAMERQQSAWTKLLSAAYGLVMYVVKLVAPVHLSAIYPFPNIAGHGPGTAYYATFVLAVVGIPLALYLLRRRREVWFGFAFYLINIVLVLQVVGVGSAVMADRYTYLPYVGLLVPLAFPLDDRESTERRGWSAKRLLPIGFLLLIPWCLIATWARCDVWQNSETLWNDVIRKYPNRSADAYVNRGYYYHRVAGRYDKALADYDRAIALNPTVPDAWNDRGRLLAEGGHRDSAIACFDHAIALRPAFVDAWNNRGGVRLMKGDLSKGIADISHAIELNPGFRDAYANRAIGFSMRGDYVRCIEDCRRLLRLQPYHPGNYLFYGLMATSSRALGRDREAISFLDRAIAEAPPTEERRSAYYLERSRAWAAVGNRERAVDDEREARRLRMPGGK